MKKKILGVMLGFVAMATFTVLNTVNSAEATELTINPNSNFAWDTVVCYTSPGQAKAICGVMVINGPCTSQQFCI